MLIRSQKNRLSHAITYQHCAQHLLLLAPINKNSRSASKRENPAWSIISVKAETHFTQT